MSLDDDYPDAGLSPRVRGNRTWIGDCDANVGSIPACAGEPPAGRSERPSKGVYPRVCGGTVHVLREIGQ